MSDEMHEAPALPVPEGRGSFPTTSWSMVLAAGDPVHSHCRHALVSLCEKYWYPLYAYVRRRGYSPDDSADLTQDFFLRILEGRYLPDADPGKGRFRSFILTALRYYLSDEGDRSRAKKRGGRAVLPFEVSSGEARYQREPVHTETPDRIFERRWALSFVDQVITRLREECAIEGRADQFDKLKVFLYRDRAVPYAAAARELNTSEGALRVTVHRLRRRYRDLFREEIANTVADPADIESELRHLASALSAAK